jgi:Tfp pilus assembly protein FimT
MRYGKGNKGTTILEIAMVVSIIGILAVLSVPGLVGSFSHYRLSTASRCLVSDLRLARHIALKENKSVRVNFIDQRSYQIERQVGTNWVPIQDEIEFTEDQGRRGVLFPEVPLPIEFDYMGKASSALSVDLLGESGQSMTVEVQRSGRVIEY